MQRYDLICIGCGPAGEKAATQAAYFGKRVAVVERAPRPGGAMINTGTVPSKALRETALLCSAFHRRPLPGVRFKLDHEGSVARFMARRHLVEQQEHDRIEASMDRHGIDVHRGDGRLRDAHAIEIRTPDGGTVVLETEHVLLATGSSPVRPSFIPFQRDRIVDADGVLELSALPHSMIVVGGGVIGCEYAGVFAEIGVDVTLVHPRGEVLPFVDAECREHLVAAMREEGVTFALDASVASAAIEDDGRVRVRLEDGARLEADVLLWAAGRRGNTDDLGLEAAGVQLDDRGLVIVDEQYRTTVASVFAAGDVIGFPALASTSMEQGRVAACHMFGLDFKQRLGSIMPLGLYTIPEVSTVGRTHDQAVADGLDVVTGRARYRDNVRGRMLGDERGLLKCVFDRGDRRLLGATIVGENAIELIHFAQLALRAGAGIDDFIEVCFNYPSLTELYKYAAYDALQQMSAARAAA
jgi:NAD(P) transhydrogenase